MVEYQTTRTLIVTGSGSVIMAAFRSPAVLQARRDAVDMALAAAEKRLAEEIAPAPALDMSRSTDRAMVGFWSPAACAVRIAAARAKVVELRGLVADLTPAPPLAVAAE